MRLQRVFASGGGTTQVITVPDDATAIHALSCITDTGAAGTLLSQVAISADLTDSNLNSITKLLCVSNTEFPAIPVSAGERLMVLFSGAGSAVICYDTSA
jgi:hypothetical protein